MKTPFDAGIEEIQKQGYYNHRLETFSDTISRGIFDDLIAMCPALARDHAAGSIRVWFNVRAPGGRERRIDLFVGEPASNGVDPDISKVRIAVENKSVITAHRNKSNRYDDLHNTMGEIQRARSEAVTVATVLVGLAERVINVPDRLHPLYKKRESEFVSDVLPRLSKGDQSLWDDFDFAVSENRVNDPKGTVKYFKDRLGVRNPAHTHATGYDYLMLVPVMIDNVNPPILPRPNPLGIDVDAEYKTMLDTICKAYTARWHF
jgi:hypothetical protein